MSFIISLLRTIFHWLDSLVYTFIGSVYDLLIEIAETTIISEDLISEFGSRIYALLGIFMLFKVSFSILNYIVNPDDFTDKGKGFHKIVGNIMISLTLLVITPWIFSKAFEIQRIVLRDNVLGNLIMGSTGGISANVSTLNPGRNIGFQTLSAFFYLDEDVYTNCKGIYTNSVTNDEACIEEAFGKVDDDTAALYDTIKFATASKSVSIYLTNDLATAKDGNGDFTMTYTPLISTAVGVVVVLLLIVFCFDIAVRSIKLGFMQLIAPIPIISRVDPKSSKDGMFSKWVKNCTQTYMDLFIRLLAIYFAIYVISNISLTTQYNAVTGETTGISPLARVFIILGALMFAKQLPKLIEDLTGIKMEGKFSLNPMKKLATVPIAGAGAALALGTADSVLHGNGFRAGIKRNWGKVPLGGGDGKTSVLETADRKMRRDINQKRDLASSRYEGKHRQEEVERQKKLGEKYSKQEKAGKQIYSSEFAASKKAADEAKGLMYAWQNQAAAAQADYQAAVQQYGRNSIEAQNAYEALKTANEMSGKAQGQYEYRKKLHEAMRQQNHADAEIEDAIEAWEKYGGGKVLPKPPTVQPTSATSAPAPQQSSSSSSTSSSGTSSRQRTPEQDAAYQAGRAEGERLRRQRDNN